MDFPIDTRIYNKHVINNQFSNQQPNVTMNTVPTMSPIQMWKTSQNQAVPIPQQLYTIVPTALVPSYMTQLDAAAMSYAFQQNNMQNTSMQRPAHLQACQYAQNETQHTPNISAFQQNNMQNTSMQRPAHLQACQYAQNETQHTPNISAFQQNNMQNTSMQRPAHLQACQYAQNETQHTPNISANHRRKKWTRHQNATPQNKLSDTNNSPDLRKKLVRRKSFSESFHRNEQEEYSRHESNSWSFQNSKNDHNLEETSVQMNLSPLKTLTSSGSDSDQWYIVVDMDVILENYTYLNNMATADPDCHLLVPHHVMSELKAYVSKSRDVQARRILRFLTQQIESGLAMIGEEVPGENISLMTIQTCSILASQNNHVILIASDQQAISYETVPRNVHVFTMQEIKNVLAKRPIKPRPISPTYAVKITVPNNIRQRRASCESISLVNNAQSSSYSTRFSNVHFSNEKTPEYPSANYSTTDNDNCSMFNEDRFSENEAQGSFDTTRLYNIQAHKSTLEFPSVNNYKTDNENTISREERFNESNAQESSKSNAFSKNYLHKRTTITVPSTNDSIFDNERLSKPNEDHSKQFANRAIPTVALRIVNNSKTDHQRPQKTVSKESSALSDMNARVKTPTNAIKVINNQLLRNQNASVGDGGPKDNPNNFADPTDHTAVVNRALHNQPETTVKTNLNNKTADYSPSKSSSTTSSLDTVCMKNIISMKRLAKPRIPLRRWPELIPALQNKPASRDTSCDSASETSIRNKNDSKNVIIEETSTSAISNSSNSSKGTSAPKPDKKKAMRSVVMFPISCQSMEDVLKTRCEEWVFTFIHIMEEVLRVKLREKMPHDNTEYPAPRSLREAASSILKKYSDCHYFNVVDAAFKLLSILHNTSDENGKIVNIQPCEYMEMYSYGVYLVDTFLDMSENCKEPSCKKIKTQLRRHEKEACSCFEVSVASESLKKLLYDIQNANLETFVDNPPGHGLDASYEDDASVDVDIPTYEFMDNPNYGLEQMPNEDGQRYEQNILEGVDNQRYEEDLFNCDDNKHVERDVMLSDNNKHYGRDIMLGDERYEENVTNGDDNRHEGHLLNGNDSCYHEELLTKDDGLNYDMIQEDNQFYESVISNDDRGLGNEQYIVHGDDSLRYDQDKIQCDNTSDKQDKIQKNYKQSYEQKETMSAEVSPEASSASKISKLTFFDNLQLKNKICTSTPDVTRDTKKADKKNALKKVLSPVKTKAPKPSPIKSGKETDMPSYKNLKIHFTKEDLNNASNTKFKVIRNFTVNEDFERKMKAKQLEKEYESYIEQVKVMQVDTNETQCVDTNKEKANEDFIRFIRRLMWRLKKIYTQVNLLCTEYHKEVTSTKKRYNSTKSELLCKLEKASHFIEFIQNTLESFNKHELQDNNNNFKMLLKLTNVNEDIPCSKYFLEYGPVLAKCKEATKLIQEKLQVILNV